MRGLFTGAQAAPSDPILGLIARFADDARRDKIDLGVGVYRDADGRTPVMAAVRAAERWRFEHEDSKCYLGMAGDDRFNAAIERLALADTGVVHAGRATTVQTPGGTGALRVAAELIRSRQPQATVWISDPSWSNHAALFRAAGLRVREYPYFDAVHNRLRGDAMLDALAGAAAGDVVLLHAGCHNPSGVDPSLPQWQRIAALLASRRLLPLVDMAYQGFGDGLDADAAGLRLLADSVDELIACVSCSKTFGVYRERTGACVLVAQTPAQAEVARSLLLALVRNLYSMPPAHGAALVRIVLESDELAAQWRDELAAMRGRIRAMRVAAADRLGAVTGRDFGFLARQRGMFSFLGIDLAGVRALRDRHAVYLVDSGRLNLAGLNDSNLERFVDGVADVLQALAPSGRIMQHG